MSPLKVRQRRSLIRRAVPKQLQPQPAIPYQEFTLGIAHDLNNLLTIVQGALDLASFHHDLPAEINHVFALQTQAIEHAKQLTQRFVRYSRDLPPIWEPYSLETMVQTAVPLLRQILPTMVQLTIDMNTPSSMLYGDVVQLQQVMVNLVLNARDALPDEGTITISVEQVTFTTPLFHTGAMVPAGAYRRLRVADSGTGIALEVLATLGTPFVTTKYAHSGLGLATCRAIVRRHHGYLLITSSLGFGTIVDVYLPYTTQFER